METIQSKVDELIAAQKGVRSSPKYPTSGYRRSSPPAEFDASAQPMMVEAALHEVGWARCCS
jgi:hypothetical protein